jgi:hypothetical protein
MDMPQIVVPLISQLEPCEVQDQTDFFTKLKDFTLQNDNHKIYLVKSAREVTGSHDNDLSVYEERDSETVVKSYYLWEICSKFPPFSTSTGYREI